MDLMDFDQATLYFDEPVPGGVQALIGEAGAAYGQDRAEALLHKAYFLASESLLVLVGLYRYYFYRHQLDSALFVAERTLAIVGRRLGFPARWEHLQPEFLGQAALKSIGLLRFYLHVLKAAGYLNLRLGRMADGRRLLQKLVELDSHDRIGGRVLLDMLDDVAAEAAVQ